MPLGFLRVPVRGGGAVSPPPRFPWEARGGRRWLIPTPSLTLRARGGREGEAQSPKQQRAERRAALPPQGGWGSRPPGHLSPLLWASPFAPESPPGVGSQKQCHRRRLGRCDSDPRVPRDSPPPHTHTDTHGGGRGDTHGGSAGRRRQGQQGLSRMRTWPRSRHPAASSHTPGNHTAALTPAQTAASHPSSEAAGHADSDRSPLPDPSPAPTPRQSPTQTHKSHTQTHTHTDSRARPLTLGATRRPQPGRVCACVTRRLLASLPFAGTARSHPIQAAPPEPPNLAAQPQVTPTGLIHTTRVTHSPSF